MMVSLVLFKHKIQTTGHSKVHEDKLQTAAPHVPELMTFCTMSQYRSRVLTSVRLDHIVNGPNMKLWGIFLLYVCPHSLSALHNAETIIISSTGHIFRQQTQQVVEDITLYTFRQVKSRMSKTCAVSL